MRKKQIQCSDENNNPIKLTKKQVILIETDDKNDNISMSHNAETTSEISSTIEIRSSIDSTDFKEAMEVKAEIQEEQKLRVQELKHKLYKDMEKI